MTNPVWEEHDRKVKPYIWSHRWVAISSRIVGLLLLVGLLYEYRALHLEWWLESRVGGGFALWLAYFGVLGAIMGIVSFPFSLVHHRVERRFGLSRQTLKSWVWDQAKGILVGAVVGSAALGLFYLAVKIGGSAWWAAAATLLVLFSIVLAQLAPVLLIPIFFKLKPMEPGPLKERLLALCERHGITVKDVYHLGLGEKTEKGNAAFTGIGRTKRILIGDTLYEKFTPQEVEAVFAHELGHQVHNDLWKGIFLSAFHQYLGFFLASLILSRVIAADVTKPYTMFIFLLLVSFVHYPLGVVEAIFSRARERAADGFAAIRTGLAEPLSQALERLTLQNWGLFHPNPLWEFLTYSHPAPWRRIAMLHPPTVS